MRTTTKRCEAHDVDMVLAHKPNDARNTAGPYFWVCPKGEMTPAKREEWGGPAPHDPRLTKS